MKSSLFSLLVLLTVGVSLSQRVSAPDCTGGSKAECVCGDGSQPDYSTFPPCPLKKGVKKPSCSCPAGESLAPKYLVKSPPRPCRKGRPACADKSEIFNLKCSDGGVPTLGVRTFPKCAAGNLLCQNGEYVTGWTGKEGSKSDKSLGVVALVHFDLRERGLIGDRIALCGTNGAKFDDIRKHFEEKITFSNLNNLSFDQFPQGRGVDRKAYLEALEKFAQPGDVCSVFTPDDTHFDIILAALERGLHVMATKPMVKTLKEHQLLVEKAKEKNVLLQIEVHKRFDPIYNDARMRIQKLGKFNYFTSYMSQPKFQLETFSAWAGLGSDISYYLNSHHIDLHVWAMEGVARCVSVVARASSGVVAEEMLGRPCEDTITLLAEWENISDGSLGHAVYTASWTAAKADVHSQQRFFCLMSGGEVTADQCHRGYTLASDESGGLMSLNPLYIRNVPDSKGRYCGQAGYGYVSFERFVRAAGQVNQGTASPSDFDDELPTGRVTEAVTAILEAGRLSIDSEGCKVHLVYDNDRIRELRADKK